MSDGDEDVPCMLWTVCLFVYLWRLWWSRVLNRVIRRTTVAVWGCNSGGLLCTSFHCHFHFL